MSRVLPSDTVRYLYHRMGWNTRGKQECIDEVLDILAQLRDHNYSRGFIDGYTKAAQKYGQDK